jgi:hypothetical protein
VKGTDGNVFFVGQHGMKFEEGGIGMIGNELPYFLFIRCKFKWLPSFELFGFNASGCSSTFS